MEHVTLRLKCVPPLIIALWITDSVITLTYQMRNMGSEHQYRKPKEPTQLRNPVPRGAQGNPGRDAGRAGAAGSAREGSRVVHSAHRITCQALHNRS